METGEIINSRYRILDPIGRGGMGTVYHAYDRLTGQPVALKQVTLPRTEQNRGITSSDPSHDYRLALAREFRTLASLRHPHIISVLDYGFGPALDGSNQRQPFFTMELLDTPLTILEAGQRATLDEKITMLQQALHALAYLHRRGIVHRDLKPDNVLVIHEGEAQHIKLLDFGLAAAPTTLTDERIAGTLDYMAPEVLRRQPITPQSDLWALGVIAYRLFGGQHPFRQENNARTIRNIIEGQPDIAVLPISDYLKRFIRRLLAKAPAERYPSAQAAIFRLSNAGGRITPVETANIRESYLQAAEFVGRQREVATLKAALERTLEGQGGMWLIGGEAGVGKSRLVEEIRTQALVAGAMVLFGEAVEEGAAPYEAWREALRPLVLAVPLSDAQASTLKPLIPDIDSLVGRAVYPPPEIDPQAAQVRLLNVIEELFAAMQEPVVLILEDLHWAGESLALLDRICRTAQHQKLLIVGTFRDDERPGLPADLPAAHTFTLDRLSRANVKALVSSMLGTGRSQPALVDLIMRETEGNVLFIVEVLRTLAEETGTLAELSDAALPETVFAGGIGAILRRRLSKVHERDLDVLQIAALAGREVDLTLMETITDELNLTRWLNACADASILTVKDERWRFAHDKIREVLTADLPPSRRRTLHERIARGIEALYLTQPAQALVLAYHWGEAGNVTKEAAYASLGGQQAALNGAHRDAIRLFGRALELAGAVSTPRVQRAIFELRIGEAYYALGRLGEGAHHLRRALRYLEVPLPGNARQRVGAIGGQLARQALHRLRGLPPVTDPDAAYQQATAARICIQLSVYHLYANQRWASFYYIVMGLNLSERAGRFGINERVSLYGAMITAASAAGMHRIAESYLTLADEVAAQVNDADALTVNNLIVARYCMGLGQWADALERLDACWNAAGEAGLTRRELEALASLFDASYLRGELERAGLYNVYAREKSQRVGEVQHTGIELVQQAARLIRTGDYSEVSALLDEADRLLGIAQDRSNRIRVEGLRATVAVRQQNADAMRRSADHLADLLDGQPPTAYWLLDGYTGFAEAALSLWQAAPTAHHRRLTRRALRYMRIFARSYPIGGPRLLTFRAWAAHLRGHQPHAHDLAQRAAHQAARLDLTYDQGLALFRQAHSTDDVETKLALLRDAALLLREIGAFGEVKRIGEYIGLFSGE